MNTFAPVGFGLIGEETAGLTDDAICLNLRDKNAPFITYGYSKDHRPNLKQILFILTSIRDGGVPVQFRCEAGNQNDSHTHE